MTGRGSKSSVFGNTHLAFLQDFQVDMGSGKSDHALELGTDI